MANGLFRWFVGAVLSGLVGLHVAPRYKRGRSPPGPAPWSGPKLNGGSTQGEREMDRRRFLGGLALAGVTVACANEDGTARGDGDGATTTRAALVAAQPPGGAQTRGGAGPPEPAVGSGATRPGAARAHLPAHL